MSDCPLGFICDGRGGKASCLELQKNVTEVLQVGDVLAGIYCPEGLDTFLNCPLGSYCPTPSEVLPCPSKYYCPHKTQVPEIKCSACSEGSSKFTPSLWGFFVVIPIFTFIIIFLLKGTIRKKKERVEAYVAKLSSGNATLKAEEKIFKKRQSTLKQFQPLLEGIQKKLNKDTIIFKDKDGWLVFDPELLFESIDTDNSRDLSYDELNRVLDLKPGQLLEFINHTNILGGMPRGEKTITEKIFIKYFFQSFKHALNFDLSDDQAGRVYDGILQDLNLEEEDELDLNRLHDSRLSEFLNESQIMVLKKKFIRINNIVKGNLNPKYFRQNLVTNIANEVSRRASSMSFSSRKSSIIDLGTSFFNEKDLTKHEKVFIQCALATMEEAKKIPESKEEMKIVFTEILEHLDYDINGKIDTEKLPETNITAFLNEMEVKQLQDRYERAVNFIESSKTSQNVKASKGLPRRISVHTIRPTSITITKDLFCQFYAMFLKEIKSLANYDSIETSDIISLSFERISLAVNVRGKEKFVVNEVTGHINGASMTAIMGASGSGKTSLLNALCGRAFYGTVTGQIYMNGRKAHIDDHKSIVGFVPQHDIVYPELTVKENLYFAGKLQLPSNTPDEEIKELTEETMAKLGLTRVANSLVGNVSIRGISGGEKKRVNIGLELMSRPRILFLDEPTSGLDSSSAMLVMKSLKYLAKHSSMTICSVIHQPRRQIFNLFDSVLLLGVGGNTVYHGPLDEIVDYFSNLRYTLPIGENVADWLLDISTGSVQPAAKLSDDQSISSSKMKVETGKVYDAHIVGQENRTAQKQSENSERLFSSWCKFHEQSLDGDIESFSSSLVIKDLPSFRKSPHFGQQLISNIRRNLCVIMRQLDTKLLNVLSLMIIVIIIALLDGPTKLTEEVEPDIEYAVLTSSDPDVFKHGLTYLFMYGFEAFLVASFAMKIGVISGVLLGLTAAKGYTDKRLEFFREAGSGYDVDAYYLALHITTLLEQLVTMLCTALAAFWTRNSATNGIAFILNFFFLDWVVVAWGLFFPLFVQPNNVIVVTGIFIAFFGMQFSGMVDPILFREMYKHDYLGVIAGLLSPTRYFVEQMAVAEQRALPIQSGFTYSHPIYSSVHGSYFHMGFAQLDLATVQEQSTAGWYWPFLRLFMVGLTVRLLSFLFLHIFNRPQHSKKPLIVSFQEKKGVKKYFGPLTRIGSFVISLYFTIYFITN